jgi:hypothetical protein
MDFGEPGRFRSRKKITLWFAKKWKAVTERPTGAQLRFRRKASEQREIETLA